MSKSLIGKRMEEALERKKVDINNFVWKGEKIINENGEYEQVELRLVDMHPKELQKAYDHCRTMLYNKDKINPGRHSVLELIIDQKDRIGVELFLRYVEQNHNLSRFSLLTSINEFLLKNKEALKDYKILVQDAIPSAPDEFKALPIDLVIDGCLDRLGTFNKKHITRTFILRQGIWLTNKETKELNEYDSEGMSNSKISVIRDILNIKDFEKLHLNSKGLNFTQMRAMLNIRPNKKYIDLTTNQLETLRYRILFNLEESVRSHITLWENKMEEIELVADKHEINLI